MSPCIEFLRVNFLTTGDIQAYGLGPYEYSANQYDKSKHTENPPGYYY